MHSVSKRKCFTVSKDNAGAGSKALGKTLSNKIIPNSVESVNLSISHEGDFEYQTVVESGDVEIAQFL